MDYEVMLEFHKEKGSEVTIAVMPVPMEEAKRFGIMITDNEKRITDFEEKPENPRSNLASMGIYIFNWPILRDALMSNSDQPNLDFGKHVIPYCHKNDAPLFAYEFNGYWKDVGTLESYWEANMELIDIVPEFNLYEEYWKIYTKSEILPPQYIADNTCVEKSIIGEGTRVFGKVFNSVIGCGVTIGKDSVIRDSIIMNRVDIGENCEINKAIIAENVEIGSNVKLGVGEEVLNETDPHIYISGIVTIGEKSNVPADITVGKNTVIYGTTDYSDYPDNLLPGGKSLITGGSES
jgi:glucose-1-phosphate adenylyltransferase